MIQGTGVIVRRNDGKILLGRRTDGKGWCGGGGHIERGETPRMAAYREVVEEFNIYPIGMKELGEIEGPGYHSWIFIAENFFGNPRGQPREIDMTRWADLSELSAYRLFEPFQRSLSLLPSRINEYSFHYSLDPADQPDGVIQYDKAPKEIHIGVSDPEKNIESLIEHIKGLAGMGHSFNVVVDPSNAHEQTFWIDGDGPDRIESMEVSTNDEFQAANTDAECCSG